MKRLLPLFILCAMGCARHKPTGHIALHPTFEPSGVRLPEVIQAYHVGRQVDNQGHLHEAHPLYRIEAQARWDLRPGGYSKAVIPRPMAPDAAFSPAPLNDDIIAELRRQQDYTERVLWEATQLAKSYDQLQPVITDMARVAKEHAFMGSSLRLLQERQTKLEEDLRHIASPTNP